MIHSSQDIYRAYNDDQKLIDSVYEDRLCKNTTTSNPASITNVLFYMPYNFVLLGSAKKINYHGYRG